ncbi:MAG: hypothetical protein ACRDMZ_23870 [Solirubrobacteraceae bacterium]
MAAFDTHALWQVTLGMGAVVLAVVIVLMMLLLSLIKDIRARVERLIQSALGVAANTSNIPKLAATPGVLNLIIEEALVQNEYMDVLAAHYAAPGEVVV